MTRTVAALLAGLLAAGLLAAGCSKADPNSQAPSVTTSVDPSATPSDLPSALPSTVPSTAASPSKKPSSVTTYPTSAKSYGQALLTAWGGKSTTRVRQLAGDAAVLQLRDPKSQDKQWTYVSCDASGDSTACLYRNSYGDEIVLTMTTAALGQPAAVTEALVDRTSYGAERGSYASEFVQAWQRGNVQRMTRLANSTVAGYFKAKTPFENFTATDMVEKVRIEPASAGGGSGTYLLTFDSTKLGGAHAITGVTEG
jgi:hypothetical protein